MRHSFVRYTAFLDTRRRLFALQYWTAPPQLTRPNHCTPAGFPATGPGGSQVLHSRFSLGVQLLVMSLRGLSLAGLSCSHQGAASKVQQPRCMQPPRWNHQGAATKAQPRAATQVQPSRCSHQGAGAANKVPPRRCSRHETRPGIWGCGSCAQCHLPQTSGEAS